MVKCGNTWKRAHRPLWQTLGAPPMGADILGEAMILTPFYQVASNSLLLCQSGNRWMDCYCHMHNGQTLSVVCLIPWNVVLVNSYQITWWRFALVETKSNFCYVEYFTALQNVDISIFCMTDINHCPNFARSILNTNLCLVNSCLQVLQNWLPLLMKYWLDSI